MSEVEGAGRVTGDENTMLDSFAQRIAHIALWEAGDGVKQGIGDVAPRGRCHAQEHLRRTVEPVDTLKQQVTKSVRKLAARAGGGEQLLREEGVALRACDDRARQPRG